MAEPIDDSLSNILQWPIEPRGAGAEPEHSTRDGGGRIYDGMGTDRIARLETSMARLEGAFDGLKHSQNMTLGAIGIAVTLGLFGGSYLLSRVDVLSTRVEALPGEISRDIQELNRTLSQSITAARSVEALAPVVIQLPETFVGASDGGRNRGGIDLTPSPGELNPQIQR
ncbi:MULTISPECIES: hypothetical protein [unclassified Aurantimonas]|uniref:hypothetical protein n=1 Tax=unclassified Aurantimonas TaxID=2638230 RepID=UPI002E19B2D8|nr:MULTISPECIES: hypothetical protein [unclassified Aurantimonas]MEC5289426.1 hypothetical protein [Aurantimonas sp. C2-3-R2]MEC5410506.1 hypothetical protein [Aurantimonas sp. C2-4-R8]